MSLRIDKHYIPDLRDNDFKNILKVFRSKKFVDGIYRNYCEKFIKKKINSNFIGLTRSCAHALEISTQLLNLKQDDEVILPSFTFSATLDAILFSNAKPIFADINLHNLCIDLNDVEKKITNRTKAIFLVHYGSNIYDIEKIIKIKKKYNLKIVEDSAHSIFGKLKNKYAGTFGDIGAFSFHESKNFCSGQGGAISVNNKNLIKKCNLILDKGNDLKNLKKNNFLYFTHKSYGSEYRLEELPSALLINQLKRYKKIIKKRKKIYNFYKHVCHQNKFNNKKFYYINIDKNIQSNFHNFSIIFYSKSISNQFMRYMKKNNIYVATHYYPLHLSPLGKKFSNKKLPNTEKIFNRLIRLPLNTEINEKQLKYFKKIFNSFFL